MLASLSSSHLQFRTMYSYIGLPWPDKSMGFLGNGLDLKIDRPTFQYL